MDTRARTALPLAQCKVQNYEIPPEQRFQRLTLAAVYFDLFVLLTRAFQRIEILRISLAIKRHGAAEVLRGPH